MHFAVFEKENLVAVTDESHKLVNFYNLNDVAEAEFSKPIRTQ